MKIKHRMFSASTLALILLAFTLSSCFSFRSSSGSTSQALPTANYPLSSDNTLTIGGLYLKAPLSWSFVRSDETPEHITRIKIVDSQQDRIENIVQRHRFEGQITVREVENKISTPRAEEWFLNEMDSFHKEMKHAGIIPEVQPVRGEKNGKPFYFTRCTVQRDPSQLVTDTLFVINGSHFITVELVYGISENDPSKKHIAESVFAHTRFTASGISSRKTSNGLSFSSVSGNWEWISDTQKGMLLHSGNSLIARLIPSYSFEHSIPDTKKQAMSVMINNTPTTCTLHNLTQTKDSSNIQHIIFRFNVNGLGYVLELIGEVSDNSTKPGTADFQEVYKIVKDLLQYDLIF